MGYCSPPGDNIWISSYSYLRLFNSGWNVPGNPPPPIAALRAAGAKAANGGEDILISGTIRREPPAGALLPVYRLRSNGHAVTPSQKGSYCVILSGAGGELVHHCFDADFLDQDLVEVEEEGPSTLQTSINWCQLRLVSLVLNPKLPPPSMKSTTPPRSAVS